MRRPDLLLRGWNRELELVEPNDEERVTLDGVVKGQLMEGEIVLMEKGSSEELCLPLVKARRAIGFACRNAEEPFRRA